MQKVTDYIIVQGSTTISLQSQVMMFVNDGYTPIGGICLVQTTAEGYKYLQAVVKYEN